MSDLTGREIRGYRLLEQVGEGNFGAVYHAHQMAVNRDVAIKIILPKYANQPEFIRSFESEAQLVARLEHIHIIPLFDFWRDPDGAYLVMRLLPDNLRDEIAESPLSLDRSAQVLDQIGAALNVAHRNGVIHRDLKPGNILIDPDNNAFLADFGIAKVNTDDEEEGAIRGTPAYISPEQIMSHPVSPQTDIYALGIMLFEMLTGQKPFSGQSLSELINKQLQTPTPSLLEVNPNLPESVDAVVQRATMKKPEDRYPTSIEMAQAFREALKDGDIAVSSVDTQALLATIEIVNPYKGLRAFEEADSADFHGRDDLIKQLMERLTEDHRLQNFLAVVGPSGSGKSSVVKAGVLPKLRQGGLEGSEDWFIAEMVPDINPIRELEEALLSIATQSVDNLNETLNSGDERALINAVRQVLPDGSKLVLMIDQFEEAFTMVADEAQRATFLNLIIACANDLDSPVQIIVTLRADFLDQPLAYPGYGELIRHRTEFVLPLSADELEQAIVSPAERVGLSVDPNLVAAIVADISEEPGALPLLQYALTEVFTRRQGITLTLDAYLESGGALGALARRAEELFEGMDEASQAATRQLFLRLVTLGEGTQDTRRRVSWTELTAIAHNHPEVLEVQDQYVRYRLLTTDRDPQTREPTVEVAHEALIREWQRLRDWLNNSRDAIRTQRRLSAAAQEWRKSGRDKGFLMTGAQLEQMDDWAKDTDVALTDEERAFLAASVVQKRTLDAREKERRLRRIEEEQRARNRLQILVAVMAIAVGVALGLTLFAFTEQQRWAGIAGDLESEQGSLELAIQQEALNAQDAQSRYLAAEARSLATAGETELALTLGVEALRVQNPPPYSLDVMVNLLELPPGEYTISNLLQIAEDSDNFQEITCEQREQYSVTPLCDS